MNAPILNREFQHPADGWYQIEPKGDHPNRAAGVVQVIDDEAARSIVNRFNADALAGALRHGHDMLIDHEHFSDQPDQETRAYGWLTQLENRDDGIYGQIRWTATGKPAVDGGDYRFFSTEYDKDDLKVLNDEKTPRRVRPFRLDGLSLTNMNNNRGQKPITNRAGNNFADASASVDKEKTETKNSMKNIASKLKLSADASEESILAEVDKLQNRVTELTPHETENATLKNRLTQLDGEQVDGLLELHGVKEEKIRNRLKPMLTGLKNREERVTALLDLGHKPVEAKATNAGTRVLNRGNGKTNEATAASEDNGDAQERAEKIKNRADELKGVAPSRSFDSCFKQATREDYIKK